MSKELLKDAIVHEDHSIKHVMRMIDISGLRVAYVVGKGRKLVGVVSDSEIRKALLKGMDIHGPIKAIVNPSPIVLRAEEQADPFQRKKAVTALLQRMPDSRYILALDSEGRPLKLAECCQLLGPRSLRKHTRDASRRHVLVVGGAGYLGSVLVRKLLARGYRVRVLDILAFGINPIKTILNNKRFSLVQGDMRNISALTQALDDTDAVINLAAIVGDLACRTQPEMTIETNYLANKTLAEACRYQQINRFLYASSCSVYGAMNGNEKLDEESPLNPLSLYARSKIQSEEGILSLVDGNFSPTILRMGTLHGLSPRMRFDLVVNAMAKSAAMEGKIFVNGGRQWRPLLHVEDAARAYILCLEAPLKQVSGKVFNVGSEGQNRRIVDIGRMVQKRVPGSKLVIRQSQEDARDYFVSFLKIRKSLGFREKIGIPESAARIVQAIRRGIIKDPSDSKYYNAADNT